MWVVVKIMLPFWIHTVIRHLNFSVPKRDYNFDNHPCGMYVFVFLVSVGSL